ncbi:MAG: hypothetical protein ACK6DC_05270, partial [Planctomycetota bacterium]
SDAARSSKKPATESGELPAPQSKSAAEQPSNQSSAELKIGSPDGDAEAAKKPTLNPSEAAPPSNESKIESAKPEAAPESEKESARIRTKSSD